MGKSIYKMAQKTREEMLIGATAKANMIVSCMVLHDKFGFGKQRLEKFLAEYDKALASYKKGYVESVTDFESVLWDECGIKIGKF